MDKWVILIEYNTGLIAECIDCFIATTTTKRKVNSSLIWNLFEKMLDSYFAFHRMTNERTWICFELIIHLEMWSGFFPISDTGLKLIPLCKKKLHF